MSLSARSDDMGRPVWSWLVDCFTAEKSFPVHSEGVDPGRLVSVWSWLVD